MYVPFINRFRHQPGFGDRLLNEVRKLAPRDVKIRISAPPERKYSTWIGGCVAGDPHWLSMGPTMHHKYKRTHPPIPTHHTYVRSILASLATFKSLWVTRQEYQEHGAHIVSKRTL